MDRNHPLHAEGDTKMHFELYKDAAGEHRWRLIAGNNRTIADSSEGYKNIQDCQHGISLLKGAVYAEVRIIPSYEILEDFGETVLVEWHDPNGEPSIFEVRKSDLDPLNLKSIEEYTAKRNKQAVQAWVKGETGWVDSSIENNG